MDHCSTQGSPLASRGNKRNLVKFRDGPAAVTRYVCEEALAATVRLPDGKVPTPGQAGSQKTRCHILKPSDGKGRGDCSCELRCHVEDPYV